MRDIFIKLRLMQQHIEFGNLKTSIATSALDKPRNESVSPSPVEKQKESGNKLIKELPQSRMILCDPPQQNHNVKHL